MTGWLRCLAVLVWTPAVALAGDVHGHWRGDDGAYYVLRVVDNKLTMRFTGDRYRDRMEFDRARAAGTIRIAPHVRAVVTSDGDVSPARPAGGDPFAGHRAAFGAGLACFPGECAFLPLFEDAMRQAARAFLARARLVADEWELCAAQAACHAPGRPRRAYKRGSIFMPEMSW